jgi:hypothetical protein
LLWFKQKSDQVHFTLVCFERVARDRLLFMDDGLIARVGLSAMPPKVPNQAMSAASSRRKS